MKKTVLITSGVVLILLIGSVWVYLFVFGPPENTNGIFSRFRTSDERTVVPDSQTPIVDTAPETFEGIPQRLRQLTTRPVAGAVFTESGIRYVEKGTGHIYEINLATGSETLVSGTTILQAVEAIFSGSGSRVAIVSEQNDSHTAVVGTISKNDSGEGVLDSIAFPEDAREIAFSETGNEIRYLVPSEKGSEGHTYDIAAQVDSLMFSIPLRDIEVLWGDETYIYTTPSAMQTGHVYRVVGSSLAYVREGAPGLMAMQYDDGIVVSNTAEIGFETRVYEDGQTVDLPISMFPEKCTTNRGATSSLICADPLDFPQGSYPDSWYKGAVSFADMLWEVSLDFGEAILLSDFTTESGREIDVSQIGTSEDGSYIWFINKNDDTLWMFDRTI